MYVTLRENYEAKEYAVYTFFGYDLKGNKEILGLWLNQTESKNRWIQDELKARGVEDVFFISMDGVSTRRRRKSDLSIGNCSALYCSSCSKCIALYSK